MEAELTLQRQELKKSAVQKQRLRDALDALRALQPGEEIDKMSNYSFLITINSFISLPLFSHELTSRQQFCRREVSGIRLGDSGAEAKRGKSYVTYSPGKLQEACGYYRMG